MIDYTQLYSLLEDTPLEPWLESLPDQIHRAFYDNPHGDIPRWQQAIKDLPVLQSPQILLDQACVGVKADIDDATRQKMIACLEQLHPWRKGPFCLSDIHIDCEWRSDWKWDRLVGAIQPLKDRTVLDVGCGNGYHCWRMAGEGAKLVIGIDPTTLYIMQYQAIKHYIGESTSVFVLPLTGQDVPQLGGFDTVFSMGVLYHRRSPFDHLQELFGCLRHGGELVLETLVIEGGDNEVLVPEGRYARMRNVWFLPSLGLMQSWLRRIGFSNVQVVDSAKTDVTEQRSTEWMRFESLDACLNPDNSDETLEGLPAPRRAIFIANKK